MTSTATMNGSCTVDRHFNNMFPSYSHNSFSRILEGDVLDEELTALGYNEYDSVVPGTTSEDINSSPGYQVAYTAAALDGNLAIEEPFFFVDTETCASVSTDASPVPLAPTVSVTTITPPPPLVQPLLPSTVVSPFPPPAPPVMNTKKRPFAQEDTVISSMTQNMLKKAKRISIQSSCGGEPMIQVPVVLLQPLTTCPNQATATLVPIVPRTTPDHEVEATRDISSADPESEAVSIVDALIDILACHKQAKPAGGVVAPVTAAAPLVVPDEAADFNSGTTGIPDPLAVAPKVVPTAANSDATGIPDPLAALSQAFQAAANAPCPLITGKASTQTVLAPKGAEPAVRRVTFNFGSEIDMPDMTKQEEEAQEEQEPQKVVRKRMRYASKEEKDKVNRDRNRVHAKNTRLRKKAYVDELKKQITDLVEARDAAEAAEARQAKILKQNKSVRFMVIENFLRLQAMEEAIPRRWETLLKEDVTMTMPLPNDNLSGDETLQGVDAIRTSSFDLVTSLRQALNDPDLKLSFECDRKSFLMDGCTTVAKLQLKCQSPTTQTDMSLPGSLKARFCLQTNKIQSARLLVDFGSVLFQK